MLPEIVPIGISLFPVASIYTSFLRARLFVQIMAVNSIMAMIDNGRHIIMDGR